MTDTIDTTAYSQILADLNLAREWFQEIRLPTGNTRFDKIHGNIELICQHHNRSTLNELVKYRPLDELLTSLLDADAFISIYKEFKSLKDHQLPRKRLRESLGGPFFSKDESQDGESIHGRDALFEMHLAARLKARGLNITGFDDIQFEFLGIPVNVQCKRIHSDYAVQKNYEKACEQLTERIKDQNSRGIVALSIEKLIGTDDNGWGVPNKKWLIQHAKSYMNDFIKSQHRKWVYKIDIRILGVIIDFKYKAVVADHNDLFTRGYETALIPIYSAKTLQFSDADFIKNLGDCVTDYTEQLHGV